MSFIDDKNLKTYNVETRINSNGKKIITFSDIHSDIHNLIICLRDCANVITGTLSPIELEMELSSHIDINHDQQNKLSCIKPNGTIYDPSLGFKWKSDCETIVVIIGDLIDGKRTINNQECEHEYLQIEFKIYAFINDLIYQGGHIYKILGNHEVMNIINPDPLYIFDFDKIFPYTKINSQSIYRTDFFKMGEIGYNAIFYKKCYVLLQIDDLIFVHGQLVGENYTYYEILNNVLNYDVSFDIKKYFGTPELIVRIFRIWYSFLILLIYKDIYKQDLIKWIELHQHLNTNIDNIFPMLIKDIDEIILTQLESSTFYKNITILKEYLDIIKINIDFINNVFYENNLNQFELILKLKPEFEMMKNHIFLTCLNVDKNELWERQYGLSTTFDNPKLFQIVDDHINAYNKFMFLSTSYVNAERVIIGHCTQDVYTTCLQKPNTSYNNIIPDDNGLIERLVFPSKSAYSYYNNTKDNLIFGITMDCKCDHHSKTDFHKLYRVDIGASRAFDMFSNYKMLFDEIEYLNFFENDSFVFQFGLELDENLPFVSTPNTKELSTQKPVDLNSNDTQEKTKSIKNSLIKNFLKTFLSRIPQVLEINNNEITIIRTTLKNIFKNQPRHIMTQLAKNKYLMQVIENGGYDFVDHNLTLK